ncbi:Transcriptional factor [Mycena kentingensis (nom. inval.)]|nr:Transcriptional factor [Mycena kentingensis (nom. inval.)]
MSARPAPSTILQQTTPDDQVDELSPTTAQPPPRTRGRDGPKKKKASRACVHCQKAHLTCDDSRPCEQRCIKRQMADKCTEGLRKKAKYLLDDDEIAQMKTPREMSSSAPDPPAAPPPPPPLPHTPQQPPLEQVFTPVPFDPSFPFGSEAANLEYSILSAILGKPSPPDTTSTPSAPPYTSWPSEDSMDIAAASRASNEFPAASFSEQQLAVQPSETTMATSPAPSYLQYPYPPPPEQEPGQYAQQQQFQPPQELHPLQPRYPLDARPRSPPFPATSPRAIVAAASVAQSGGSQLQNINDRVTMPYDYTEGYHFLMKHLPSRFEKNDILRIVRALAIFRPSLIALQMPLSFDDEVFVEKCFQRTLLELDKLISFSGTPTVVWRRTGEICLVAPEFCMLTEWSMDELIGRKKYIYELFENQSVVEYWENFASHAFENTTQSVYAHCVLLKPTGAPVPCTFCFSIRRDLFDLPSVVIGQWLPLL